MGQEIVQNHDLNALASAKIQNRKMKHDASTPDSTRFFCAEKLKTMRVKTVDVLFKNNLVFLRSAARVQLGI
jgi:hypothetical protein